MVLRTLDILDGFFHRNTVGFSDVGLWTLVFLLDFGLLKSLSFDCVNIEILSAFITFLRLLFNQLLSKLICI